MDAVMGIDLGSTTCKAVILDERGGIIGRGITHTRTNHHLAAEMAAREAEVNARFALLEATGALGPDALARVELLYRQADYRHKHRALVAHLGRLAEKRGQRDWLAVIERMGAYVEALLLGDSAGAAIVDRSRFFRDLAGLWYTDAATRLLPAAGLEADDFLMLLDLALPAVENEVGPLEPGEAFAGREVTLPARLLAAMEREEIRIRSRIGTGYGRQLLPFPPERIVSEIMCHARGAHRLFPGTRTVLDIGGQDTKAIQVDPAGIVTSFQMNDRCAAGCGRYLAYVADEAGLGLSELGPTACGSCRFVPVTSTCTVFAGAEVRTLLHAGERKEDVLMGLHRAVVLRAFALLARSGGVSDQFTFTGGVAKNTAISSVLREIMARRYPQIRINIHPDSIYTGAIGAALYALEDRC